MTRGPHNRRGELTEDTGGGFLQTRHTAWLCTTRKADVRSKKSCDRAQQSVSVLDSDPCDLTSPYVDVAPSLRAPSTCTFVTTAPRVIIRELY